ncbi:DUF4265 domain-containing protein [Paeniglutamicibacter sp. NPDC012692]|uniref:DUF4265 domain-containing protein n=1 Tax=Paeniglutamicibacter sp. NPDC012692 TaxID=3364388 RepID=UPI00367FA947
MDEYRLHPSLVTHWHDGDLEPLPDSAAANETVWFALPVDEDGVQYWEGLNGKVESDGSITVLGVPAYAYDLRFGDRVTVVRSAEGPFVATGMAQRSGNYTFRFLLADASDETGWYPLAQEFATLGCLVDVLTPRFTALSCDPNVSQAVTERLAQLSQEGLLEYEIGHMYSD